jgi:hypothetical protein
MAKNIVEKHNGRIGSEVFQALKMGRKAIGVELKKTYFDVAARNAESAELENSQMEMFT